MDKAVEQYKKVIENPNHFESDESRYAVLLYFAKTTLSQSNGQKNFLQRTSVRS